MNKTTLIAGKDAPAGAALTAAAAEAQRNVLITVPLESANTENTGTYRRLVWNRPSPVSARSLVVQAENAFGSLDEAVLVFDAQHFAPRFTVADAACFTRAVDEMMLGYFFLAAEITGRFAKREKAFDLVFLLRTGLPEDPAPDLPVLTSQAAFTAFAENLAAKYAQQSALRVTLARAEGTADSEIASWLFPFLDAAGKKRSAAWLKIGAKPAGMFSFLR